MTKITETNETTPHRTGILRWVVALFLATSLVVAPATPEPAVAHSKSSNFCGGNHWYGAYRHRVETSGITYENGEWIGYICWFSSLGGIGGGKYHSISLCP